MLRVVMYGADSTENGRVQELLGDILWDAGVKPVFKAFTGERAPFFTYVRNNPYLVMLVLQSGPAGTETVRLAKEANPRARIVWFSDHDYALYAYGLHLTFFGLLPVSRRKLEQALEACWSVPSLAQFALVPQPQTGAAAGKKASDRRRAGSI